MAEEASDSACPICRAPLASVREETTTTLRVHCNNCGNHLFDSLGLRSVIDDPAFLAPDRARLAAGLVKVDQSEPIVRDQLVHLIASTALADPTELVDNLVLAIAAMGGPGQWRSVLPVHIQALISADSPAAASFAVEEAYVAQYIATTPDLFKEDWSGDVIEAKLTSAGWHRRAELLALRGGSRFAFMAMKFCDEMRAVVGNHMTQAVARAGFKLRTVADDHKTAGNIDNRMRVEIRTSRFMVCDLTHSNQGAYWEAGFAEGIGRPVIYTCRKDVLEAEGGVHFDTRQQLIIPWDPADIAPAMRDLTNVIRATLPAEAKLTDD